MVDPGGDFIALGRLFQSAPGALAGEYAAISRAPVRSQRAEDGFREFAALPPVQRIRRYGDWHLNFPLVSSNGRLADFALIKLFISPDWSGERPILTIYLNDQIVAAARAETGQSDVSVPLPTSLLRFSNILRVTLERAGGERYCAPADQGQAAQIFLAPGWCWAMTRGPASSVWPIPSVPRARWPCRKARPRVQRSDLIWSWHRKSWHRSGREPESFPLCSGRPPRQVPAGCSASKPWVPAELILSIADQVEGRDLRYEADSSLAVLSAQDDGRTLLVQLSDAQNPPQPGSLYLGGGSKALVANRGVVWQNSAPRAGPSMVRRAWALGDGIFSKAGVAIGLVVMSVCF